eukprot:11144807-Alexandrium_andersonii.AAC.1
MRLALCLLLHLPTLPAEAAHAGPHPQAPTAPTRHEQTHTRVPARATRPHSVDRQSLDVRCAQLHLLFDVVRPLGALLVVAISGGSWASVSYFFGTAQLKFRTLEAMLRVRAAGRPSHFCSDSLEPNRVHGERRGM